MPGLLIRALLRDLPANQPRTLFFSEKLPGQDQMVSLTIVHTLPSHLFVHSKK
jgi:hypothetical protein